MDSIYLISFKIFRFIVKHTPDFLLKAILDLLSWITWAIDKKHRKIIKTNLDFAYGDTISEEEKKAIEKKCYKNLLYFLADFVKNQGITKEKLSQKVTFKNKEILENAIKQNKKIIVITAHYGNWELISLSVAAFFGPVSVVGRKLEGERIDQVLKQNREQFDIEVIDKMGGMRGMIKALKQNRLLGVLVDQNTADNEGVLVNFFGKKARQTHSTALIARKLDALIIPAFITTNDYKNYEITFYDEIEPIKSNNAKEDIQKMTQLQADAIEKAIRKKPDEWFWFHKRWKNQYEEIYR